MPTVNQLVRKGRKRKHAKIKATALRKFYNTKTRKTLNTYSPQKRGVCLIVKTMTPKNQTRLCVKLPVFVYLIVKKAYIMGEGHNLAEHSLFCKRWPREGLAWCSITLCVGSLTAQVSISVELVGQSMGQSAQRL